LQLSSLQLKHYWQLNEPVSSRPGKTLAEHISGLGELTQFAAELQEPMDSVLYVFPEQPPKGLHIIVQKPLGESYVDLYVVKCPANVVLLFTFSTYLNRTLTMPPSTRSIFPCIFAISIQTAPNLLHCVPSFQPEATPG